MTKKIICAALVLTLSAMLLASCGANSETSTSDVSDSTNLTVVEEVTDENGETVTDEAGEAVTEVYEEVPVVDKDGKVVKDENGKVVTKKVPATESKKEKNTSSNSGSAATTKPSGGSSSTTTTKPSGGSGSTTTTKPSGGGSTTTTKPSEKPTESTTEKPTQKPTEPTTERSENIDYFVSYAINYGTEKLGLTYRSDFENASWDNPITMKNPIVGDDIEYYEGRIRSRLESIKKEGNGYFFVKKENRNGSADRYNLYIGY